MPEDIQILRDITVDGVRHITAVPSALVCSRQIDFDLVDGTIRNLRYTAGCHGNLQALGALLEGQPVAFALDRLTGINCKGRGTSCSLCTPELRCGVMVALGILVPSVRVRISTSQRNRQLLVQLPISLRIRRKRTSTD